MAELGVVSSVTVFFKGVPIKFKIEVVARDGIDKETKKVAGIDAIEFKKELQKITREMEYKGISHSLKTEGIEFYGMETIAQYVIKKLRNKFPIYYVKVWEGEDEWAIVYSNEI